MFSRWDKHPYKMRSKNSLRLCTESHVRLQPERGATPPTQPCWYSDPGLPDPEVSFYHVRHSVYGIPFEQPELTEPGRASVILAPFIHMEGWGGDLRDSRADVLLPLSAEPALLKSVLHKRLLGRIENHSMLEPIDGSRFSHHIFCRFC